MLNLAGCSGGAECLELLAGEARRLDSAERGERATVPSGWVLAFGARTESWTDRRWPTRRELDAVIPDRACAVMSFDHHAVLGNTRALVLAGISDRTPDPAGGIVVREPRTGEPTGLLLESAAHAVWNAAPEPSEADRRAQVCAALHDLGTHGFTEVHDLLSPDWLGPLLAEMCDRGELSMRVELYPAVSKLARAADGAGEWRRDRVALGGGKLFADGTLNSRTAWMLAPYADPLPGLPCGKAIATREEIVSALRLTESLGLPLATHAIGDAAVRAVLDAIETVAGERRSRPGGRSGRLRHRIEHAELIDASDTVRFARLGVVASVQPCHLLTDIEALTRSLPDRLSRVLPLRALIDDGCAPGDLLVFGSDTPIVRPNPDDSVLAATERRRAGLAESEAVALEQRITPAEAWCAFGY